MVIAYDEVDEAIVSCTESTRSGVSIGMICSVLGVTPAQISALRAKPSLVRDLVLVIQDNRWKSLLADVISHTPAERQAELVERQTRFEQSPAGTELSARTAQARLAIAELGAIESELSLESSWPVLRFVLTEGSTDDPLLSGEIIGEDLGHGPARLHSAAQTAEFSQFLVGQDAERLKARVDLDAMASLGASVVPEEPISDEARPEYESQLSEVVGIYFPRLRDYVRTMADKRNGLLVWL